MNKKGTSLITMTFLVLFFSTDLMSQESTGRMMGKGHMRGMVPGNNMGDGKCFGDRDHMKNDLKMSDDQIKTIGKINWKYSEKLVLLRESIKPKNSELRKSLLKANLDFPEIKKLLKEISYIEVDIRLTRIMQRTEIEKVFTPSQLKRLREERMHHLSYND